MPANLVGLSLANERRRARGVAFLSDVVEHFDAGRLGELAKFFERIFDCPTVVAGAFQSDQQRPLGWRLLGVIHLQWAGESSSRFRLAPRLASRRSKLNQARAETKSIVAAPVAGCGS